jgi:hypothetical protein
MKHPHTPGNNHVDIKCCKFSAGPSGMQSQIRRPKHETFYFVVAHIHDQTIPGSWG